MQIRSRANCGHVVSKANCGIVKGRLQTGQRGLNIFTICPSPEWLGRRNEKRMNGRDIAKHALLCSRGTLMFPNSDHRGHVYGRNIELKIAGMRPLISNPRLELSATSPSGR